MALCIGFFKCLVSAGAGVYEAVIMLSGTGTRIMHIKNQNIHTLIEPQSPLRQCLTCATVARY